MITRHPWPQKPSPSLRGLCWHGGLTGWAHQWKALGNKRNVLVLNHSVKQKKASCGSAEPSEDRRMLSWLTRRGRKLELICGALGVLSGEDGCWAVDLPACAHEHGHAQTPPAGPDSSRLPQSASADTLGAGGQLGAGRRGRGQDGRRGSCPGGSWAPSSPGSPRPPWATAPAQPSGAGSPRGPRPPSAAPSPPVSLRRCHVRHNIAPSPAPNPKGWPLQRPQGHLEGWFFPLQDVRLHL